MGFSGGFSNEATYDMHLDIQGNSLAKRAYYSALAAFGEFIVISLCEIFLYIICSHICKRVLSVLEQIGGKELQV